MNMLFRVKIESPTLNGEIDFDNESMLLSFLKSVKKDAYVRSEPEIHKRKFWGDKIAVATKEHPLKISIIKL
jgi:hypothetical protein